MRKPAKPKKSETEIKAAIQLARKKGEIVDSIDQLVCSHHSEASFSVEHISGSRIALFYYNSSHRRRIEENQHLNLYFCDSCQAENLPWDQRTIAYDCPECGIVTGHYHQDGYSYGNGAALSSGSGTNYLCRICETKIGESPLKIRR